MKFKCKLSGLVYDFPEWDVEGMKKHPDYEMVVEDVKPVEETPKRGRPAKLEKEEAL
jgi:hypothetical protein